MAPRPGETMIQKADKNFAKGAHFIAKARLNRVIACVRDNPPCLEHVEVLLTSLGFMPQGDANACTPAPGRVPGAGGDGGTGSSGIGNNDGRDGGACLAAPPRRRQAGGLEIMRQKLYFRKGTPGDRYARCG